MQLVPEIPFDWRESESWYQAEVDSYLKIIVALSGQSDGHARIQGMNEILVGSCKAPQQLITRDSAFWTFAQDYMCPAGYKQLASISERIGRPGTPLVANYWINRGSSRDSQSVAVNDGKIRVIEFGGLGCPGCVQGMLALERLHNRYPEVEFNTLSGVWTTRGNRVVGAKAVAEEMANHITNFLHITYPYGMELPKDKTSPTDDGGEVPVYEMANWDLKEYPGVVKPTFYIVDGSGMIRFICLGGSRENEEMISRVIEFLQKETAGKSHT